MANDPAGRRTLILVAGALFSAEGKLLLLRSAAGEWQLPGGPLEFGEAPELALVRCVRETTDMDVAVDRPLGAWSAVERTGATELCGVHIGYTVTLSGALLNVEIDRDTHAGFAWVTREEARARITAPALRDAVERAFSLLVASRRG